MSRPLNIVLWTVLLGLLVCVLVLAVNLYQVEPADEHRVWVVVTTQELPFGTQLDAETMLTAKAVPHSQAPDNYVSNPMDLHGRLLLHSLQSETACTIHNTIPGPVGKTAVLMQATDVREHILPNSEIDLLAAVPDAPKQSRAESFVRNAKVLAVDRPTPTRWSLVVALSTEEAEELVRKQARGAISVRLSRRFD